MARWVIRYRHMVIVCSLLFVGISASGMQFLTFTTDYRAYFSETNPQLNAFESLQNTYSKYDNLLFVLAPTNGNVFTRQTLTAIEWLTAEAWKIPYSSRVDSLSNFQHTRASGDELIVEDLYQSALELSDTDIDRIRTTALSEPMLLNRLVSARAHVTGVNVTVQLPGERTNEEVPEVAAAGRRLKDELRTKFPHLDVHLTGIVMMNAAFPEASKHDLRTLVPLMFLVVFAAIFASLRSLSGTLATVLVVGFSIVSAMGLAGWAGIKITGPVASSPIIILTLAVADCVHLLSNFVFKLRRGASRAEAMAESLRINLQPIVITSLTTAVGFLSMNFSEVPPFRDLGNIVAVGVGLALVFSVTFLPAFMNAMPAWVSGGQSRGGRLMETFAEFVVTRRNFLLWVVSPLMLILIAFIPKNELNDELLKYFDETIEFRRATDFASANLSGIYTLHFSLESGESGGVARPDFLAMVERFSQWFRQQPEVVHVNALTDTFKRLNKNLHGDDPAWYRVPEHRELAAQYLLLYEMSLPYGLDLNDQINVDKSSTRLVVTTENLTTNQQLALEQRAQEWLKGNGPVEMRDVHGTSATIMFAHITERNIRSMLVGTTFALIGISLILAVALRSVKIALISMIPNLVPAALAFGLWGILVGQVGLAISVVTAMTLGIVVDDTVHFLSKYIRATREEDMDATDAVRYAFATVGKALWVTSIVLIVGFLVLSQSAYQVNAGMGLLAAITIAFALLADFLFLPPLLIKMAERSANKELSIAQSSVN